MDSGDDLTTATAIKSAMDRLESDAAASVRQISDEATRRILAVMASAQARLRPLAHRLATVEIAARVLGDLEAPGRDGGDGHVGRGVTAPRAAPGPARSSRLVILEILVDAGGTLARGEVKRLAHAAGVTESAYKKMRARLRQSGSIVDHGDAWVITDQGRDQATRSAPEPDEEAAT